MVPPERSTCEAAGFTTKHRVERGRFSAYTPERHGRGQLTRRSVIEGAWGLRKCALLTASPRSSVSHVNLGHECALRTDA